MNWLALDEYNIVVMSGTAPHIDENTIFPSGFRILVDTPDYIVPEKYYFENSTFIAIAERPNEEYTFNRSSKTWNLDIQLLENKIRRQRNILLSTTVDTMNSIRWETLTDTQKQQWIEYRQALLDVPQQEGFPNNIEWPIKPE